MEVGKRFENVQKHGKVKDDHSDLNFVIERKLDVWSRKPVASRRRYEWKAVSATRSCSQFSTPEGFSRIQDGTSSSDANGEQA